MKIWIRAISKAIPLVVIAMLMLALLTGCENAALSDEQNPFKDRFAKLDVSMNVNVLVDTKTGVCYLNYWNANGVGSTVLLDTDGTLLLYEEAWYQMYEEGDHAK